MQEIRDDGVKVDDSCEVKVTRRVTGIVYTVQLHARVQSPTRCCAVSGITDPSGAKCWVGYLQKKINRSRGVG